jgi:hypothetical protein
VRTGNRTRRLRLWVGGAVVLATFVSSTTVWADGTTTTTMATTAADLPPAPAGFGGTVIGVYQSAVSTASVLGQGQDLESVAQYSQQLTPSALAALYYVSQQVPQWSQLPSLMQTIAAGVSSTPGTAPTSGQERTAKTTAVVTAEPRGTAARTPPRPRIVLDGYDGSTTPGPFQAETCPSEPSDGAVFAAQVVVDVLTAGYNALDAVSDVEEDFGAQVAAAVTAGLETVAAVVHDVLAYQQQLSSDCEGNNLGGQVTNIDNTTVFTYGLITSLASAVATMQNTETTTDDDAVSVQGQLSTLQSTLENSLASDTETLQDATASDSEDATTGLQTIQTALEQDTATVQSLASTTGQKEVGEVDKDNSALQASLSADLSRILQETDTDAQGLTTLVTQGDQQIMNALQSSSSAQQQQYDAALQTAIEQGLSGWGAAVPDVQFMLPTKMGGLLNAMPVGVQEVVTTDIQALQHLGVAVKSAALTELSAANTALAAGSYTTAWSDYALAYQAAS